MRHCGPSWSCIHFLGGVMLGTLRGEAEVLDAVRLLPGEQVDFPVHVLVHVAPALGGAAEVAVGRGGAINRDRKSTRLNSSHGYISYAVFCLKKKKKHSKQLHNSRTHKYVPTRASDTTR